MIVELNTKWLAKGSANHAEARRLVANATTVAQALVGPAAAVVGVVPGEAAFDRAVLAEIAANHPNMDKKIMDGLKEAFNTDKSAVLIWVPSPNWSAQVNDAGDPVTITIHCPSSHSLVP